MPLPCISHPLGVYPSMFKKTGAQQYVVALAWLMAYVALACWLARAALRQNMVGTATSGAIQ